MNEIVGNNLLKLVRRHAFRTCIPAVVSILFVGYLLAIHTRGYAWLYWAVAASIVYLMRPVALDLIIKEQQITLQEKLVYFGVYSFIAGGAMGISIVFFPQIDLVQRLLISLILAGFCAGSSSTNAGYSPFFLCYSVPVLVPLGVSWMLNSGGYLNSITAIYMGLLIIMMIAVLAIRGRDTFDTFSAYIELSENQSKMSAELADALEMAEREKNRAEAGSRSKTRFLAAASHDLRQPVHVVSLYGAVLESRLKDTRSSEVVDDMNKAINSLSKQLNELLDISKLDSDMITPEFGQIELKSTVGTIIEEFQAQAGAKRIELVNSVETDVYVRTDGPMLSQILRNIVGNAIKYTNQGSVTLTSTEQDGDAVLCCQDTGIGISDTEQQHIFEEFYQIDNPERNEAKGLGLGLSIVQRLAQCLSHELNLESKPGIGTCVSLRLELISPAVTELEKFSCAAADTNFYTPFNNWIHIVDDDPNVCKSMQMLLEELGCRVTSTSSTMETVKFIEVNRPDAVFVDLRLQGDDSGIKTLNAIESIDARIYLVMITGETIFRLNDIGLNKNVKLLHKPIGKARVVKLLKELRQREQLVTA